MVAVPFSFLPKPMVVRSSKSMLGLSEFIIPLVPLLKLHLRQADMDIEPRSYISMCLFANIFTFAILFISSAMLFDGLGLSAPFPTALIASFVVIVFIFLQQMAYPRLVANRKVKGLEKNLLAALQNILVQLNAGIPLFDVMVNVSRGDYGDISTEFAKAVREINAGKPQIETIEDMATANPSLLFRRVLWQLVNGMKTGSDLTHVIKGSIDSLAEEQVIQIQKYGGQLNPLAMFYMLAAVIIPSLGMTFLIIIASFTNMPETITKIVFWALLGVVVFFQIMFMGIIKSKRPNLIAE